MSGYGYEYTLVNTGKERATSSSTLPNNYYTALSAWLST
jgi:hypothetical protein